MKSRTIALSLLLIAVSVMSVSAQGFHLGVKGGANLFKVDGQSMKDEFNFGYNVGAFAEINFSQHLGIQPEVMWNQTNYRTGHNFHDIYPEGVNDVKGKLNYLTIPLLLSIRPVKFITLQVGPQFGILMDHDKNLVDNGRDAFKKGELAMVGGVQLNLAAFKLGARYVIGLTDINDLSTEEKWKNQGFQIYTGFRFF